MINENEKSILSVLIINRLSDNWNKCDQLPSGSAKYNALTEECTILRDFARKHSICLPPNISARF